LRIVSAALVVQVLVTGLGAGATYGLVAIGFAQVYRMTGVLQVAHGHVVAVAMLAALGIFAVFGGSGGGPLIAVAAVVGAVVVATVLSAVIAAFGLQRAVVRRSDRGWIALIVAVAFALEAGLLAVSRRQGYAFPQILPAGSARIDLPFGAAVAGRTLWQLGIGLVLAIALERFMTRTMPGRAMAAVASDRELAHLAGLPVTAAVTAAFGLAGALAAVAGILTATGRAVGPHDGVVLGLWGIAAAAVVGFGRRTAVFVAALMLGVVEAIVVNLYVPGAPGLRLGPAWAPALPLIAVLLVLALRPPARAREEPA
jgi:branched-chain amino acid transport system permease protein